MTSGNNNISILIVDDEKRACNNLKTLLNEYAELGIQIAGVANSTSEADQLIKTLSPDAVFLDIDMPNENAFHFLERIKPFEFEVVFVTAYDEYAVKAFRLNAVDYILKPISIAELRSAVQKLKEKIKYKQSNTANTSFIDIASQIGKKVKQNKIILRENQSTEMIDFRDIYYIEAQSSYCKLLFRKDNHDRESVMSSPLSDYEELLPPNLFYRIHKSYLINCAHVKKMLKDDAHYVVIKDEYTLPVSRRRYPPLVEFLRNNGFYNNKV